MFNQFIIGVVSACTSIMLVQALVPEGYRDGYYVATTGIAVATVTIMTKKTTIL